MASVDEKVVSLEFDNKQFESAVAQTLQSLENLKDSLNFKGVTSNIATTFNQVQQSIDDVDFSKLSSDIEQINDRFSTMGIIGGTAIAKLTSSAMSAASTLWQNTIGQIYTGGRTRAQNLEMANFQLEGLGFKGKKLETLNENIKEAVSGTAYGLDEAAKVAAQLAASQIKEGDDMYQSLRAIAGVAAMTGSEYSRIGDIFTTVAGNGKLMSNQLLQMSSAGLNGAAAIAKYLNSVDKNAKVTEADVREMVTKGKIDFSTFSKAMTYNFGDQASKANETFSGALSNMKAALSRIGADFFTPYLQNMRDVFNTLREFIDAVHEKIKPFLDTLNLIQNTLTKVFVKFSKLGGLMTIFEAFQIIFNDIGAVFTRIGKAFNEVFGSKTYKQAAKGLNNLANGFKWIAEQVHEFTGQLDWLFGRTFKVVFQIANNLKSTFGPTISSIFNLLVKGLSTGIRYVEQFVVGFFQGIGVVTRAVTGLFKTISQSKSVKNIFNSLSPIFTKLADVAYQLYKVFYRLTTTIKWSIFRIVEGLLENLADIICDILTIVPDMASGISSFIKALLGIDDSVSLLDLVLEKLSAFENFIKSANKAISDFYKTNIKTFSENLKAWRESEEVASLFNDIGQSVVDIFSSLWGIITDVASVIGNVLNTVFEALSSCIRGINVELKSSKKSFSVFDILTGALKIVRNVLKVVSTLVVKFVSGLKTLYNFVSRQFVSAFEKVGSVLSNVFESITNSNIFETIKTSFEGLVTTIYGVGSFAETGLYHAFETIKNFFSELFSSGTVSNASKVLSNFFKTVKNAMGEKLTSIFTTLGSIVLTVWDTLKNFFSELANNSVVQEFAETLKNGFLSVLEFLANGLVTAIDGVNNFINTLKSMDKITFPNVLAALGTFKDSLLDFLDLDSKIEAFKNFFEGVLKFIFGTEEAYGAEVSDTGIIPEGLNDTINNSLDTIQQSESLFDKFLNIVTSIKDKVLDILKSIETADIMALAVSGSILKLVYDISESTKSIQGVAKSFSKLMDAVSKSIMAKVNKKESKTDQFQKIIKSMMEMILVIVAAIVVLSLIDTDKMMTSAGILTSIVVVIGLLVGALMLINSKTKGFDGAAVASALTGLATSVLLIVLSLKVLEGIELNQDFAIKLGILAGIFVALSALVIVIGKIKADFSSVKNIAVITTFISSIMMVILALKILQTLPLDGLAPRIAIVAGIFVALSALVVVIGKIHVNPRQIASLASISAMAKALLMVIVALFLLNFISLDDDLPKKLAVIGTILLMLSGVVVIISAMKVDAAAIKNLSGLKSVAVALLIVVAAIAVLSLMDEAAMTKAMKIITWIGVIFAGLIAVTGLSKDTNKAGRMLLMMATSLIIMVGALAILNNMDEEALQKSINVISTISIMLIGLIASTSLTKGAEKGILGISLVLISLTACIGILSTINADRSVNSAISISILLGVLTGCMVVLSKVKNIRAGGMLQTVVALDILSTVFIVLASVVVVLSNLNITSSIISSIALISGMLAELTGIYTVLAVLSKYIKGVNPATMIELGASFAAFADVVVVIVGALFVILGALNELTQGGLVDTINSGAEVLSAVGTAIGGFVGSIIGGVIGGITGGIAAAMSSLLSIGASLSSFMTSLSPFLEGVKSINPEILTSIGTLSDAILKITAAELIDSVLNFVSGGDANLESFGEKVSSLCNAIVKAAEDAADISDEDGEKLKRLAELVTPFVDISKNLEGTGGLLQDIIGEKDLGKFGETILAMCNAFNESSSSIEAINFSALTPKFEALKEIISPFIDISKNLEGTGGLLQDIIGEKDLGKFGETIELLCGTFARSSEVMANLNFDDLVPKFQSFRDVISSFVEISNSLEGTGGLLQSFVGEKDLGQFGQNFEWFASCFQSAANKFSEIGNMDQVQAAISILSSLIDQSARLVNGEGSVNNLPPIVNNLKDALVSLCDGLSDVNIDDVSNKVKTFTTDLIDNLNNLNFDQNRVDSLVSSINSLVDSIKNAFSNGLNDTSIASDAMNNFMDSIINALNNKKDQLISDADSIVAEVTSIMSAMPDGSTLATLSNRVGAALNNIKRNSESKLSQTKTVYSKAGREFLSALQQGLTDSSKLSSIYNAGRSAAQKAYSGAHTVVSSFTTLGANCAQGIIDGASSKSKDVYDAFSSLGSKSKQGYKDSTKQKSPSKEFIKMSGYNVAGLVKGISLFGYKAEKAYYSLGEESVSSAQAGLNSASLIPVLDFNSADISALQSISSGSYNIGANVNTRFLNGSIENLSLATLRSNNKVVSAINMMSSKIDSVRPINNYMDGITYDDGTNIANAIQTIAHEIKMDGRS